jgi:serine/threonine protein kinase
VSNQWYKNLSADAKQFLGQLLDPNPSTRLNAKQALAHPWLLGQTPSTVSLSDGHVQRLLAYQRLQKLRANILAVLVGINYGMKDVQVSHRNSTTRDASDAESTATTVNMDMFKEAFALFDKDESGDIDKEELVNVMTALGQLITMYIKVDDTVADSVQSILTPGRGLRVAVRK